MRETPALAVSSEMVMEERGFSRINCSRADTMHSFAIRLAAFFLVLFINKSPCFVTVLLGNLEKTHD